MKTERHVSQMGADMALQLMLMTLFRIVADLGDDPEGFLSGVRTALSDLAASYPLPELPAGAEKQVRDAAQMVITAVMVSAGSPQTH
jgi:hypothetical protein